MQILISGYGSDHSPTAQAFKSVRLEVLGATDHKAGIIRGDQKVAALRLGGRTRKVNANSYDNPVNIYIHSTNPAELLDLSCDLVKFARGFNSFFSSYDQKANLLDELYPDYFPPRKQDSVNIVSSLLRRESFELKVQKGLPENHPRREKALVASRRIELLLALKESYENEG